MPLKSSRRAQTTVRVRARSAAPLDTTSYVQIKNSSNKDTMIALDLSYRDAGSNKKLVHLADSLQPQKTVTLDFAKASIYTQVVTVQFRWKFGGIAYGSSQQIAKVGSYFYTLQASLKPDGSEEFYKSVQAPL
jgi:hypothetical protein